MGLETGTILGIAALTMSAGGAAFGAYSSIEQAEKQNEAIEQQLKQARTNMDTKVALAESEEDLISQQAMQNRDIVARQQARKAAQERGTARARWSNQPVAMTSGSPMATIENMTVVSNENQELASLQASRQIEGARRGKNAQTIGAWSEFDSIQVQAMSGIQNSITSAVGGAFAAAGTGLNIGSSVLDIRKSMI